ncbi:hypothetical protein E3P77_01671 [Wallemia ichthyophaga]|nr:hypothetical protein E3P77_01671 [Wallemia ichthyophaga]
MSVEDVSEWEFIGNKYYARSTIYQYGWDLSTLKPYRLSGSPLSSALAIWRDTRNPVSYTHTRLPENSPSQPFLHIFSADAEHLATITSPSAPVSVGFSSADELVVVLGDLQYRVYNYSGKIPISTTHTIPLETPTTILDARIAGDSLVILTAELLFYHLHLGCLSRPTRVASMDLSDAPADWAVVSAAQSHTGLATVIAATDNVVHAADSLSCSTHPLNTPHTAITLSPNGRFIALLAPSLILSIMTSDLSRLLTRFDASSIDSYTPDQLVWCGSNAIGLVYNEPDPRLWLVGPGGEHVLYPYHDCSSLKALSTMSSLLVVSPENLQVVQKVPESVQMVFGETDAGALSAPPSRMLLHAHSLLENGSSRSDDVVRSIGQGLLEAIDGIIAAAGEVYVPSTQRSLLKAAQYGWQYLSDYNSDDFIKTASTLRVLNAYRSVGIPLSKAQFDSSDSSALIQLLLPRRRWGMAIDIARHLHSPPDAVLVHWANAKIHASDASVPDEELSLAIVDMILSVTKAFVGWSDVARVAHEVGRVSLATKMLDREPRASEVVPQLKRMKEDRLALLKAIESSDPDLIIDVLLHLRSRLTLGDFFKVLEDGGSIYQPAKALLVVYAKELDRDMLRDFYFQDDRRVESAKLDLAEAEQLDGDAKIGKVRSAMRFFSEEKKSAFESRACDEYQRLLHLTNGATSVNDAIRDLLGREDIKGAEKIKSTSLVVLLDEPTETRYNNRWWYLRMHCIVEKRNYTALEQLASGKKSPIGYEPFVKALKKAGNKKLAVEYIRKCEPKRQQELLNGM